MRHYKVHVLLFLVWLGCSNRIELEIKIETYIHVAYICILGTKLIILTKGTRTANLYKAEMWDVKWLFGSQVMVELPNSYNQSLNKWGRKSHLMINAKKIIDRESEKGDVFRV